MASDMLFRGVAPALITPFTAEDEIDEEAFRGLVDRQIEEGVSGLVVLGTTGENPTITDEERRRLVDLTLDATDERVPVIVGTGTNNTEQSIAYTKEAARAGADGALVVGPYYNKPTQKGFVGHVKAIGEAADIPLILYNVPGRTGFNIAVDTVLQLAEEVPEVVGVKEASGDLEQIAEILLHRPDDFAVYSGDDEMTLPLLALGGDGVVSVISNALPEEIVQLVEAGFEGKMAAARDQHFDLLPAMRACFLETNPIPIKDVCASLGWMESRVRLPLESLDEQAAVRQEILAAFDNFL